MLAAKQQSHGRKKEWITTLKNELETLQTTNGPALASMLNSVQCSEDREEWTPCLTQENFLEYSTCAKIEVPDKVSVVLD